MRDYAMVLHLLERDLEFYCRSQSVVTGTYDPRDVAATRQVGELFKKLAPDGQSDAAVVATVKKFIEVNNSVSFVPVQSDDDESMTYMLHLVKDEMWRLLDNDSNGEGCDFAFLADNFLAGPGASRLADSTNWYAKMWDSNHSYTDPYVLSLFRAAVVRSETWTSAYLSWEKSFRPQLVSGNSLFTVPKNSEISRTCCTEPLLNMMFQQAVGSFIENRLRQVFKIDLARQPDLNRRLCREGSRNDAYGTIDLSSASDSIATTLCEWACPPTLMKWLRLFRCAATRLPDGSEVLLNMVSTMGNGFTFPLETAIFASAVRAVYIAKGVNPATMGPDQNYAVFGDDIVIRKDCYATCIRLLSRLGFKVNDGKSFNDGPFRESCGYDYYRGVNIRPVYIRSLEKPHNVYSAFNRLSRWSAEHRLPIVRTLGYLLKMAAYRPVPFSESDDCGFKVPCNRSPLRFNGGGWYKYTKLVPVSTAMVVPVDATTARKAGYKSFNPHGWELAFLGGYAHNRDRPLLNPEGPPDKGTPELVDEINRRPFQGEVLARRVRTSEIPFWDWFGAQDEGRFAASSFEPWQGLMELITPMGR